MKNIIKVFITLTISGSLLAQGPVPRQLLPNELVLFKNMQLREKEERAKEVSKVMNACKAYTQDTDRRGRHIADEVLVGMGDTCKAPQPQTGAAGFLKDIQSVAKKVDQNKLWDEMTKISLEKSVNAYLSLHMKIANPSGTLTPKQAVDLVCAQAKEICFGGGKDKTNLNIVIGAVTDFLKNQKVHPTPYFSPAKQEVAKTEFNKAVYGANNVCNAIREMSGKIKAEHACFKGPQIELDKSKPGKATFKVVQSDKPVKQISMGECDSLKTAERRKMKELEDRSMGSLQLSMQMVLSTEIGPLLATESFRKTVGSLSPTAAFESCTGGKFQQRLLNFVSNEHINKGRQELYNNVQAEIKQIQTFRLTPPEEVDKEEEIERYLKTNPYTIAEMLKRTNSAAYAKSVCYYIKDIHSSDKIDDYVDNGIMMVGVAASVAFMFVTDGLGAALVSPAGLIAGGTSLASTSYILTDSTLEYYAQLREDKSNMQSMATKQRDLESGIREMETSDANKEQLASTIKWTAVGGVLEVAGLAAGIKKGVSLTKSINEAPELAKVAGLEGKSVTSQASILKNGYSKFSKILDKEKLKLAGPLSPEQDTKLAALFSGLDDAKSAALAKQLASLDQPGLQKFFLMLDDVSMANPSTPLLTVVDDFIKSGRVKRIVPPMTVEEIAKLAKAVPRDPALVAKVYPKAASATLEAFPKATPLEVQKLISNIRTKFRGQITDVEVGALIERYSAQGAKNVAEMEQRFTSLTVVKDKYVDLFASGGVLRKAFQDESELTKLAYIDELERNGIPLKNAAGDFLMDASGKVIRKDISKMAISKRFSLIVQDLESLGKYPCST